MNKTFRKAMLSTICMLVVAVVSLTGVTYAWFTQGTYSEVSGLSVQVESATGGIFIAGTLNYDAASMPAENYYSQSLDLNSASFGGAGGVKPVSTIGDADEFDFYTAKLVTPTTITTEENTVPGNVFKYYLYLRNDNSAENMTVNLGGNSLADGGTSPATIITGNAANEQGKTIQNAARIGIRYVATTTLEGGDATVEGSVNSIGFGIFSNEGTPYLGVKAASEDAFEKGATGTNVGNVTPTATTDWEISVPSNSIVVIELLVWVEGQDPACVNANAATKFDVKLYFDRVE